MTSIGSHNLVLGLAGDLIVDSEKLTQKHDKAGGRPIFAGTSPALESSDVICRVCGAMLSLVVQVRNQSISRQFTRLFYCVKSHGDLLVHAAEEESILSWDSSGAHSTPEEL